MLARGLYARHRTTTLIVVISSGAEVARVLNILTIRDFSHDYYYVQVGELYLKIEPSSPLRFEGLE